MMRDIITMMLSVGPIHTPTRGIAVGDSTIADGSGKPEGIAKLILTEQEKNYGFTCDNIAAAGDLIAGQLSKWNALATKNYDWVCVQVGLNDMDILASSTLSAYQNLINTIRTTNKPGAKIIACCMLPCKQRWIDLGWSNGQSNWLALNNSIMTTINNVDGRVNSHVPLLDDGNGNLAMAYNSGDNIHENTAGALIIKDAWRSKLVELGMLIG